MNTMKMVYVRGGLSTNSRWKADVCIRAAKQPSFQASADVISDRVSIVGLFPRAAKNVLVSNRRPERKSR